MSNIREEAELLIGAGYSYHHMAEKQAKRVLILLDALEKLCSDCDIDCQSSDVVCDYQFIKEAIAKAEQV